MLFVIRQAPAAARIAVVLLLTAALAFTVGLLAGGDQRASGLDTGSSTRIIEAELVTSSEGWALSDTGLSWTDDAGSSWTSITPPVSASAIRSVAFDSSGNGWVAAPSEVDEAGRPSMQVYSTSDRGQSWTNSTLPSKVQLTVGGISTSFADPKSGWVLAGEETSAAVSVGHLYATSDGGASWQTLPDPPVAGKIRFYSSSNGWLAGGVGGGDLYSTDDGGYSWTRVEVKPPEGVAGEASYGLPRISADGTGSLPVTFTDEEGDATVGVYATTDAGASWSLITAIPLNGSIGPGTVPPVAAFAGDEEVLISDPGSAELVRVDVSPTERSAPSERTISPAGLTAFAPLDFAGSEAGIAVLNEEVCEEKAECRVQSTLLVTQDGGESWQQSRTP
jgi:photosystem II stability/assembly factor-like uncharacterized protein